MIAILMISATMKIVKLSGIKMKKIFRLIRESWKNIDDTESAFIFLFAIGRFILVCLGIFLLEIGILALLNFTF